MSRSFRPHVSTWSRTALPYMDSIEWEELPSMADSLTARQQQDAGGRQSGEPGEPTLFNSAWTNTLPADLVDVAPTEPFRETLSGLVMREVHEPEVFRHFFG